MIQRWVRFFHADETRFGLLEGDQIRVYEGDMFDHPVPSERVLELRDVKLLMPTEPSKVIAMWNNFRALGQKLNLAIPAEPLYLIKAQNSYLNPEETIQNPSCGGKVVFEGELGIVIGKPCKSLSVAEALNYVFGYTCANDVTVADILHRDPSFVHLAP